MRYENKSIPPDRNSSSHCPAVSHTTTGAGSGWTGRIEGEKEEVEQLFLSDNGLPTEGSRLGPSALLFVPLGTLALGLALLRAGTAYRAEAALLVVGAVSWFAVMVFQESLTWALALFVPFCAAWVAIGYGLWTDGDGVARGRERGESTVSFDQSEP